MAYLATGEKVWETIRKYALLLVNDIGGEQSFLFCSLRATQCGGQGMTTEFHMGGVREQRSGSWIFTAWKSDGVFTESGIP